LPVLTGSGLEPRAPLFEFSANETQSVCSAEYADETTLKAKAIGTRIFDSFICSPIGFCL